MTRTFELVAFVTRRSALPVLLVAAFVPGCSSSSNGNTMGKGGDAGGHHDSGGPGMDAGRKKDASGTAKDTGVGTEKDSATDGAAMATTTIAAVRQNNPSGSFTVKGYVTALAGGMAGDFPQWYIEDPAGGQYSGIVVYCDPAADVSHPCKVPEPALHDLILVTGTLSPYMGQLEIAPTGMTVLQSDATPPPVATVMASDVAPKGNSAYRGVFVKLDIPTALVVDSVTPSALADTGSSCAAVFTDGGVATCTSACSPPVYSGFQANDGTGNEVFVIAPFYLTDPLQSSPECLAQPNVVDVVVGTTFSSMQGVLDVDPYSGDQTLAPVQASDYTISKAK